MRRGQRRYQRRRWAQSGASLPKAHAYGVEVAGNATFTNSTQNASPTYLGVRADPSKDVTMAGGSSLSAGIMTKSAKVINNGLITLEPGNT